MIVDLEATSEALELKSDLCVIGSGAAGLALASEMIPSRKNVVLVESGGQDHEPLTQALYDVTVSGLPHPGSTQGRFRILGGSTTKWGGQTLPLMPSDFQVREWVPNSGWPISFEELNPYYERACRFLLVDRFNFDTDLFPYLRTRPPYFDQEQLWYHFSKWGPKPNLREHYLPGIRAASNCSLLLHANVTDIQLDEGRNRVASIQVRSLQGHRATLRAQAFVLCAGGIETARLLMANNKQVPGGIGNEYDLVGRYFQDHPSAFVGRLDPSNAARAQQLFNVFHKRGLKYSVRTTATPKWQRVHKTLNISMGATFVQDDSTLQDLKDIYVAMRQRQLAPDLLRKLLRTIRHPASALLPAYYFLLRSRSFAPGARMLIGLTSEQEPNRESRISLSDTTDALGMPRANVCWKLTDLTLHTIRQFAQTLRGEFRRAGIGEIVLEPWVLEDSSEWMNHITDQYHHIGTTRMHDSSKQGVVDRNCQVHGVSNLFVGSSAVFPTSGHSNPTLTIIALCIRLADRLRQELG
ncbi:MAG: GMC family oxidoreductase [Acidobacteriia bacterium]|nr:GMC family oxidoreductase [Terriglobia bacterium]